MNINFAGRTVIVTGAARGIGRALAVKLAQLDAKVIALSRSKTNLESLRDECKQKDVIILPIDLNNWTETQEKLSSKSAGFDINSVDMLVNNAATSNSELIGDIKESSIDEMFSLNYKSSLNLIQLVCKGMKERKRGSIVNISSVSGMAAMNGHCVYGSSKRAMDMLTRVAAKELGPFNVRVNSINPTVVWTDLAKTFWEDERLKSEMISKIPMGRFVEVEEVVGPVVFMLSDYAAMINGTILPIDGGFTAC